MFNLCVLFAVAYMLYYHVFRAGDLQAAEYSKDAAAGEKLKSIALAKFEQSIGSMSSP